MSASRKDDKVLPVVLAALVVGWGLMGWFDLSGAAQAGFDTDGNNTIIRVYPGSPAETAGVQVGDLITQIERIPVVDAASIARLPRVQAGTVRVFTVERAGEQREFAIRYDPLPPRQLSLARVAAIIGLCFLAFPLLAYFRSPSDATRVLTIMGVGLSLAFIGGPYIAEAGIRAVTTAITSLFVLVGIAAMLQFLLVFPQPRPWLQRRHRKSLLYLPALLLWCLFAYRLLLTPPATGTLNTLTNLASAVIVGAYLLVALFLVLRNYSRTDRAQRQSQALNGMLWGTVLGLVPVTIAQLVSAFSPQALLPGQDHYFVTLALIPFTWSRSASRAGP
jgi:hypothetical protein